jgi:hypothetical protein
MNSKLSLLSGLLLGASVLSNSSAQDYNAPIKVEDLGPPFAERKFTPSEREFAKRAAIQARSKLSSDLKDFASARFQGVRAILPQGRRFPYFCGQLNSKNSFGAYTGWQDFYVDGGLFELKPEYNGDQPRISRLQNEEWRKRCSHGSAVIDTLDYSFELKQR